MKVIKIFRDNLEKQPCLAISSFNKRLLKKNECDRLSFQILQLKIYSDKFFKALKSYDVKTLSK